MQHTCEGFHPLFLAILLSACGGSSEQFASAGQSRTAASTTVAIAAEGLVAVAAYRHEYSIEQAADGSFVLTRLSDGEVSRHGAGPAAFSFTDRVVSFDRDGKAGMAYRIYQAAFDRKPDQAGLGYWIDFLNGGGTPDQVAAAFVGSAEFQERYGSVDNRTFAELVYRNVLHRAPDQAGLDYWLGNLERGLSRAALLSYFSESEENRKNVAPDIAQGITYVPGRQGMPNVSPSIFAQPASYVAQAPDAAALTATQQLSLYAVPGTTVPAAGGYPAVDPENRRILIAAVQTAAGTYGPVSMRILEDGTLAPEGLPQAGSLEPVARYDSATGVLTMDLLDVGPHHYAETRWHLERNGTFRLVSVRAPLFSDYVQLLPDVFVGGRVDTHNALPTSVQQLSSGGQGDLLMLGNAYWDFGRQGLDRYRAGPQNLLKWEGGRFVDVSASLVAGGIPAMFQVESEKMLADFNGDGRLDVILGGNGADTGGNTGEPTQALLSSGAQGYVTRQLPNGAGLAGHYSWVHGGAALKLHDKARKLAFIGDYTFGPSYLVQFGADGAPAKLEGRLPAFIGQGSTAMNSYFKSADFPVTAALGVDLDGDGADELVVGSLYSYSAALVAPQLNEIQTMVLKQDAWGSFAGSTPIALPNGPFAKRDCYQKPDCSSLTVKQIATADFNRDGLADLLITHHLYGASFGSKTQLLINKGKLVFEDVTQQWFGSGLEFSGQSHIHSYAYDLNGDGCADVVLRGDDINSTPARVFMNDCKSRMVDYSQQFQLLGLAADKTLHGGIPVSLGGKPAILLFGSVEWSTRFSVARFKYRLPTPSAD